MNIPATARVVSLAIATLAAGHAPALHAQQTSVIPKEDAWEVTIAPYAYHFSSDDNHKSVWLIGLERQYADGWLWGAAFFSNSFGQKSGTAYVGYIWNNLFNVAPLYAKLTAGIMYGYVEPYEDKVPFNHNGWSPTLVPAMGYRLTPNDALQVALFGTAGVLFSYNRRF